MDLRDLERTAIRIWAPDLRLLLRPAGKSIDQRIRDSVEYRARHPAQKCARKLVVQRELDLARIGCKLRQMPLALETLEGALFEMNRQPRRPPLGIARR
jgi:hypothetical protein